MPCSKRGGAGGCGAYRLPKTLHSGEDLQAGTQNLVVMHAGGKAAYFAALGFIQRLFGWPVNSILAKRFKLLPPGKQ